MDKTYTREVTKRFLEASDIIMSEKKLTQTEFTESVDLTSSNLVRMRTRVDNNVSIESICEMIDRYGISPVWLITGHGDKFANSSKIAAKEMLKSRIVGMELAVDDIKQALKALKKTAR